jgi:hypothetical protein
MSETQWGCFMNRTRKLFWIDILNFILFLSVAMTGIIIKYVLPHGSARPRGGGRGFHGGRPILTLWEMDRHQWGDIHFWLSIAFCIALIVHLIQHRRWIGGQFKKEHTRMKDPQ